MRIPTIAAAVAVAALAVSPLAPALAAPNRTTATHGKPTGQAKANVNRPAPSKASGARGPDNKGPNRNTNAKRGGNNVVAGNTVVVGGKPGNGYYDNGHYHDRPDWDDDDNDFLEFVGKTAAVTAGVSVVSAVIGSVVKDKPSDCQPVVSASGQQYLYCNGTYYQQVSNGYQVTAPPAS